jgi:hypothetical protein
MEQEQYGSFSNLRSLVRQPKAREHCDLCGVGLSPEHQHLIDPASRKLVCACGACAILFPSTGQTKYKRVPRRIRFLGDFRMTDAQWDSLSIPIGMAFFLKSSIENRVLAFYPSPAGPTESMLSLETWEDIVEENPVLLAMESDTEGLLVNRLEHTRRASEYYVVPIDKCYELVGLIRSQWRGFSGGAEVWQGIQRFFNDLKERAAPEVTNA